MIKKIIILMAIIMAAVFSANAFAHSEDTSGLHHAVDEGADINLFHMGQLSFPVWTYYAEIIEHVLSFAVLIGGIFLVYYRIHHKTKLSKKMLDYALWGFVFMALAELVTTLHHFLIHLFGIANAVINHGLFLIGLILLVYSFYILRKK